MKNHDQQPASYTDVLATFSKFAKETPNIENLLEHDCQKFCREFGATHYVAAITLGALEYAVYTEEDYYTKFTSDGKVDASKLAASASASSAISSKVSRKTSNTRKVGAITKDGTVERGSYGEAVVGVKLLSISSLIKNRCLHKAMKSALMNYINTTANVSSKCSIFFLSMFAINIMYAPYLSL